MPDTVLKLANVSKTYPGVRALDRVSLDCRPGEVHAIVGENGSGKSTLMKIASGTVTPDDGVIEIDGRVLPSADPREALRLGLATVYQDDSQVREMTVAQNLFLGSAPGMVKFSAMVPWATAQLAPYGFDIPATALVGDLSPAQRQFVEIVKALITRPKVLLLDEPTSTLDFDGVRKLATIIRELTGRGTGIIYVSHRLPEILELADRVTILRDGVHRGTFAVTPDLSEHNLVSLMVGRDFESEYPAKLAGGLEQAVLSVRNLTGDAFQKISFDGHSGEILGFAGAEGNGQREALRALAGLDIAHGTVTCTGRPVDVASPGTALSDGVIFLSADRAGEAIFPELSVQKNLVASLLHRFAPRGLLSRSAERRFAEAQKSDFGIVTASLEDPVIGLSGGNQQKSVLARSFRAGARVVLIDEPTQGVDAGARYEIYKAIRENIRDGRTCVINSSDAQELAGICDRVLVFSRGRIVRELKGDDVTEEKIVSAFLTARDVSEAAPTAAGTGLAGTLSRIIGRLVGGTATWWMPVIFLSLLTLFIGIYAASQSHVFLKPINFRHILLAAAPIGLAAMAQLQVLLVRGLDVSIGSLMSLIVVAASFLIGADMPPALIVAGVAGCLLIGALVGLVNGSLIRFAGINAVITTIAMLSVLQGLALIARPTPGGQISTLFTELLRYRIGLLPLSALLLVGLAIAGDHWLHRTRSGLEVKAVGFREEAARRNGIRVSFIQVRAYVLASLMAALAGLFLGSEVGVGHPTVGQNFALTSIAAAVLGGAALTGGRGSFGGALFGAFFFTLMVNVISILGLSSSVGVIASGIMTLLAIFLYSGLAEVDRFFRRLAQRSTRAALVSGE